MYMLEVGYDPEVYFFHVTHTHFDMIPHAGHGTFGELRMKQPWQVTYSANFFQERLIIRYITQAVNDIYIKTKLLRVYSRGNVDFTNSFPFTPIYRQMSHTRGKTGLYLGGKEPLGGGKDWDL